MSTCTVIRPRSRFRVIQLGLAALLLVSGVGLAAVPLANLKAAPAVQAPAQGAMRLIAQKNTSTTRETSSQLVKGKKQGSEALALHGGFEIPSGNFEAGSPGSPRVAAAADFDADGVGDLVVVHNDVLVVHRGDLNAFAPQTDAAWQAIHDGRFVSPFQSGVRILPVPIAADFVLTGDFNRDTHMDIAFAARGGEVLFVFEGDGNANFANLRRIEIGGPITALTAGDVNRLDGLPDLIVGVTSARGSELRIFQGLADIFKGVPQIEALSAPAEAIAVGQLNENSFADIAVATGGEVMILSGKDSTQGQNEPASPHLRLPQAAGAKAIVVGDLLPDRDSRTELAVLSTDGTIRIFTRGSLDTRPVSRTEHLAQQVREYRKQGYPIPAAIAVRLTEEDLREPSQQGQGDVTTWAEAETMRTAAPSSVQTVLATGRISDGATDDLIVLDRANGKVLVLPFENDYRQLDAQETRIGFAGKRTTQIFDVAGVPVAALAMKLNFDNDQDLLVLREGSVPPTALISAPQATFTVNSAADAIDNNIADNVCNTAGGVCTLRAAIMQANRTAGDDVIMINAGINPTISLGQPDNDGQGTNDQATGDLDITCAITDPTTGACNLPLASNDNDLSIIGAAGGNTVTAGTFTPYPTNTGSINTDRVFDVGQDGIFGGGFGGSTGVSATFTNLTIQSGNVREALNTALGGGNFAFGGGIRYDGFRSGGGHGSLNVTNSTLTNNQSDNAGGGVYHVYGSHNASGATFSGNITNAGEGGGLFFGAATSASNVNISNSAFTANQARQGIVFGTFTANADGGGLRINADPNTVTIGTTNFTNNIAQQDGGAIKTLGAMVTVTGGTMTGNTARRHGGVAFGDEDTANSPAFATFSGSTMRNNTANSDNAIFAGDGSAGDGGAIFRDRGTLNITNCTIGGTGAGEPNTATNGGGMAHAFTVDSAAGNDSNQTVVTINGGSINGNVANTDGGGVYFNSQLFDVAAGTLSVGQTTATALTGNKAKNNGGGIHVSNAATANLKDMTLRSNQANSDNSGGGDGGALYQNTGTTTFTGTLAIGGSGFANTAVNGGGIRNNAGTVTLPANASITFNTASGTGGGISNVGTLSAVSTATITNNTATGNGGGIFNSGTLGAITTPTLNSNSGASGGGIFSSSGNLVVSNGSISSNTAGGGIAHSGTPSSSVTGVTINGNTGHGILITVNSLDATSNTITNNTLDGIAMTGAATGGHFGGNTIHTNGGLGIDLGDNGVTGNDVNDVDTGPNNLQNFPVIEYVRRGDGVAKFALNAANGSYRVQFYANTACDPSGNGEGEVLVGTQTVTVAGNNVTAFSAALAFGAREQITAIATHDVNNNGNFDDDGNTSEFSQCRQVNTLPTIAPQAGNSRQQGSPVSNTQIAVVNDIDQTENTLVVTVGGGASQTVNGVTISNIVVSSGGFVTADIVASCTATNANFTLRVTDNATEFNESTLSVSVTPNAATTFGTYSNTIVQLNGGGTVTPSVAPTDNGTFTLTVAASPNTLNDDLSVNQTTGVVTIAGAEPFGTYTVTVTATDNCGATSSANFQVVVNAPPAITAQAGVTRQRGSVLTNTQVATVSDADQAEETLAVSVNGGSSAAVNDVTVSNLAVNSSGVVTADVVVTCSASDASFTLRITDTTGAFTEATLSIAVTANPSPTVGTYPDASVTLGNGTTVTPASPPTDNGTVDSATAAAPGFNGTLTVNPATGVVTVSNATPSGIRTVTVTLTDNCGAQNTAQFTLTVNEAPSITSANSVTFTEGNFGSFTVTANGFPAPTFSATGTLPNAVTFAPSGLLSGVPDAGTAGNYPLQITATNGVGSDDVENFTLTVLAPVCVTPPADLIAWYPAEANAIDVKNGHNGTPLNGAGFGTGKVGQAFTFDGANAVVEVPDDVAWDFGTAEFTVQTWVKFNAISGADVLVAHDEGGGSVDKWIFWLRTGSLEFHLNGSAVSNITSDAAFAPVLGQWYHVAVTRSGMTYKFYVNGAQNGTDRLDTNTVPNATAPLTLGKAEALPSLNGSLDEVQIFNRALLASEVLSTYNSSTEGFCVDALAATGAASRKTHGGAGPFDVNLPLTGEPGVECRTGGANGDHTIVVTFNNPVTEGGASANAGSVVGTPTFAGNAMTINLTGIANAQQITVSLSNVKDAFGQVIANASAGMNVLVGDTTGNKRVSASDVSQVKAETSNPIGAGNFRTDVSLNGVINGSDLSMTKAASGTFIP